MTMNRKERHDTLSNRPSHLAVRKQRIEHWAYKGRNESIYAKVMRSTVSLGTSLEQRRAEGSLVQADRRLKVHLYRLGEQREKSLERHNFDQKLFANKQALRYKENPDIQSTLNYVRKSCKFSPLNDIEEEYADRTLLFEEDRATKTTRSRSLIPIISKVKEKRSAKIPKLSNVERFLDQKDQVPLPMPTPERGTQSAHVLTKSRSLTDESSMKSAHGFRSTTSAPARTRISHRKDLIKPKQPSTRLFCTRSSLQEFRRHPERFLSQSNRYLPLLRRQATTIKLQAKQQQQQHLRSTSRSSDPSEVLFDEMKSFLSDDNDIGKPIFQSHLNSHDRMKLHAPSKINLMETPVENPSEYTLALSRLRDRQYAHLQHLIRSNSMTNILQPLSPINPGQPSLNLQTILHSMDALRCSTTTTTTMQQKQPKDIEKNLSKLGLLIF